MFHVAIKVYRHDRYLLRLSEPASCRGWKEKFSQSSSRLLFEIKAHVEKFSLLALLKQKAIRHSFQRERFGACVAAPLCLIRTTVQVATLWRVICGFAVSQVLKHSWKQSSEWGRWTRKQPKRHDLRLFEQKSLMHREKLSISTCVRADIV
jgi:hypothetical protein